MSVLKSFLSYFGSLAGRFQRSRVFRAIGVAVVSWCMYALVYFSGAFDSAELKSLDFRFLSLPKLHHADTSIVLVAIDQNSLDFFDRQHVRWPWPRQFYGLVVDYLHKAGARAIAFDMDFSSRDIDRLEVDGVESDSTFAAAMRRSGNVVLAVQLTSREPGDEAGSTVNDRFLLRHPAATSARPGFDRAVAPIAVFQQSAARLGVVNFEGDQDDIARRVSLSFPYHLRSLPHLAAATFAEAAHLPPHAVDSMSFDADTPSPRIRLLYWYGKGGPDGVFRYVSIAALITSEMKRQQGLPPDVPVSLFKDKIVVIGGSAAGLFDFKPTPYTAIEPYAGMEIHATLISNLLNNHAIRQFGSSAPYILGFVLSLCTAAIFFGLKKPRFGVGAVLTLGFLYAGIALLLFYYAGWWIPLAGPEFALGGAFLVSALVSYGTEGKQKRRMRKAFNRYLSPHVVSEILQNANEIELGGKLIEGTVYFSDIKSFTTISEQHAPKELVAMLNEYLSLASDCILRNDAMIDKYIGDAVMAIFGAPIPRPDHARVACLTALEVQHRLTSHYQHRARETGGVVFETRIGLNSGNMIVGNIGNTNRLDYTAIGDTVNLASRLEGVNKMFGTKIIISESTYRLAGDAIRARELDLLRVKGKNQPIRIYELIGDGSTLSDSVEEKLGIFAEALRTYRARQFGAAIGKFEEILRFDPDDAPSAAYIERCRQLLHETLPEDWDGVYTLTSK